MVCLVLQYSGVNYSLFSHLPYEVAYPLGRLCELVPYVGIVVVLKDYFVNVEKHATNNSFFIICFLAVSIIVSQFIKITI